MTAIGGFLHNMLGGADPEPGPPYVHTLEGPIPPLPDYKPYRVEIEDDGPGRCFVFEDEPVPPEGSDEG